MPRLFLFGIGGTGSRVVKSLTMLMASGVQTNGLDIVPILIDPHKDLNELKNCKTMLSQYIMLREGIYENYQTNNNNGFFKGKIVSLNSLNSSELNDDFDFDSRIDETFGDFLEMNNFDENDPNKDLINLLFSDYNLKKRLSVGFKGNPNIGCVVLNQFDDANWYKDFGKIFSNGDKIFIISSIFGGTGAAGFPILVKNLRNHENKNVKDAEIGALTVMPYFKLKDPDENNAHQDIDSNNFFTKTKAALSYYSKNLIGINALYYMADPDVQNKPYVNDEVGQPNNAHIVELIGASSIIHFCKRKKATDEFFSFGLEKDDQEITFKNLGDPLKNEIMEQLRDYYMFTLIHPRIEKNAFPFKITSDFKDSFFRSEFFGKLSGFNANYFIPWLNELDDNERKFSPFNLNIMDDKFHTLVKDYQVSSGNKFIPFLSNKFETANFAAEMSNLEQDFKLVGPEHKTSKYMEMMWTAINKVNNKIMDFNSASNGK